LVGGSGWKKNETVRKEKGEDAGYEILIDVQNEMKCKSRNRAE
jgi:hypothetical protein